MKILKISDFAAPELDVYARLNESQLYHYNEPAPGIFIAESPKVITRALAAGYEPISFLMEERYLGGEGKESSEEIYRKTTQEALEMLKDCLDIPIYTSSLEVLRNLTGFPMTRGALCAMRRKPLPSVKEICEKANRIVVLENVVNPTNVGAIFRSAAALGMDAILLKDGCSDPLYRRASRVSMGTVFQIPWTVITRETLDMNGMSQELFKFLKKNNFITAAMALKDDSISIEDSILRSADKLALFLGAEGDGLSEETIAACDYVVRIPMAHGVDSLNVAAARDVAFWELRKR